MPCSDLFGIFCKSLFEAFCIREGCKITCIVRKCGVSFATPSFNEELSKHILQAFTKHANKSYGTKKDSYPFKQTIRGSNKHSNFSYHGSNGKGKAANRDGNALPDEILVCSHLKMSEEDTRFKMRDRIFFFVRRRFRQAHTLSLISILLFTFMNHVPRSLPFSLSLFPSLCLPLSVSIIRLCFPSSSTRLDLHGAE